MAVKNNDQEAKRKFEAVMKSLAPLVILTVLLLGLPMLGATSSGHQMSTYLQFPPHTRYVQHAPFSWPAFALLVILALLIVAFFIRLYLPARKGDGSTIYQSPFPWWGWTSAFFILCFWALAWRRPGWFHPFQNYTFTPLWTSFVVFINAVTFRRVGSCLLTRQPRYLLALFPASALFWWYFEYLNRFSQNWYYLGQELFTPLTYTIHASLAFSTVLPAVMSTAELLQTHPALQRTRVQRPLIFANRSAHAVAMLTLASLGLIGVAVYPDYWYPVLWLSPLLILVSLQVLFREGNLLQKLERGEWQAIALPSLAALVCGFFWEMWNHYSYPKWEYCIPYVQRFEIFEMPLVGYLGYLPFGLQCCAVADMVGRLSGSR
jgi:hypothetical protein